MIGGRVLSQRVSFGRNRAKLWGPCAVAGYSKFLLKRAAERTQWGKKIAALVLRDLQRIRPCAAKKPFRWERLFTCCLFFIGVHELAALGIGYFWGAKIATAIIHALKKTNMP